MPKGTTNRQKFIQEVADFINQHNKGEMSGERPFYTKSDVLEVCQSLDTESPYYKTANAPSRDRVRDEIYRQIDMSAPRVMKARKDSVQKRITAHDAARKYVQKFGVICEEAGIDLMARFDNKDVHDPVPRVHIGVELELVDAEIILAMLIRLSECRKNPIQEGFKYDAPYQ